MLPDARPRFGAALSTHTFAADVVVPLGRRSGGHRKTLRAPLL
jgi:hypothetical protein